MHIYHNNWTTSKFGGEGLHISLVEDTEFRFLTLFAGGVPRDFFNEKSVPWPKKV